MPSKVTIAAPAVTTIAVAQFEQHAKAYRAARDLVSERVDNYNAEILSVQKRLLPGIKSAVAAAKDAKALLAGAVETNPGMFEKPRTMSLHGITFGMKKGSGKATWECEDDVLVARIEKYFADDKATLELLIVTKRTPSKDALKNLDAKTLAKLGVEVEGVDDVVVVKTADSEVDKLVKRILEEGEGEKIAAGK